jgi:hypothetical protein
MNKKSDQSQKFIDAAKELGADVDEETLRKSLSKLAKAKTTGASSGKSKAKNQKD